MKRNHPYTILRALTLLLALSLLLGAAAIPVYAAEDGTALADPYMTWKYFPSSGIVNGTDPTDDTVYRYVAVTAMSARIRFLPNAYYAYANTAETESGASDAILAPHYGSDFILFNGTLMATNAGIKTLTRLNDQRTFHSYRMTQGDLYCDMDEESLRAIANTYGKHEQKQEHSLFDLRNKTCYTVLGFNEDGWFGVPVAFVYEMDDGLYYASALDLTDDCFDGEGNLRPKSSVSLWLYPLDEDVSDLAYEYIRDVNYHFPHYTYENQNDRWDTSGAEATPAMALISIVFLGILLPAAPITLGLCLPRSKKMGNKKRWYLLAALGGAWALLGILILILTVIAL